jgi:hypothetical protein
VVGPSCRRPPRSLDYAREDEKKFFATCRFHVAPFDSLSEDNIMKYLLLIYDDPKVWANFSEQEVGQYMGEYRQLSQQISESGHMLAGAQLQPETTATTVRIRDGKRLVHDGPFAETREVLGGYYLVEAKDLDEAIGIAARIPSARVGTIEVRPLVEARA